MTTEKLLNAFVGITTISMNNPDMEKLSDLYKLADMVWTKAWVIANQAAMLAKMADDEALKTRMVLDEIIELIDEEEKKTKKKKNGE